MGNWEIQVLYGGEAEAPKELATPGLDGNKKIDIVFFSFLVTNGSRNILFDCGINAKYIVDGLVLGVWPAKGGESFLLKALREANLSADDIDTVVYSHFHLDHAGNCHLFPRAAHVFQEDEWKQLLDPTPAERAEGGYDQAMIPALRELDCRMVDGDIEIDEGLRLYKTPGHSVGSQVLQVATKKGRYILASDLIPWYVTITPQLTKMVNTKGQSIEITPASKTVGPVLPPAPGMILNYFGWYSSVCRVKALSASTEFIIPGHDASIMNRKYGGS